MFIDENNTDEQQAGVNSEEEDKDEMFEYRVKVRMNCNGKVIHLFRTASVYLSFLENNSK